MPEALVAELGLVDASNATLAVVISHDCDCVADEVREPTVEVLLARAVARLDGNFAYAKSTRKLQIEFSVTGKILELDAADKYILKKEVLAKHVPETTWDFTPGEKYILRNWLAARYSRPSFPDEFVRRINPVQEAIKNSAKKHGTDIEGIFIYFEPEAELASDAGEIYEVYITAVYDSERPEAEPSALLFTQEVRQAFERRFKVLEAPVGLLWSGIELVQCNIASDIEFTYKDVRTQYSYRLDDLSLRTIPQTQTPAQP